jgi:hypothetical protein
MSQRTLKSANKILNDSLNKIKRAQENYQFKRDRLNRAWFEVVGGEYADLTKKVVFPSEPSREEVGRMLIWLDEMKQVVNTLENLHKQDVALKEEKRKFEESINAFNEKAGIGIQRVRQLADVGNQMSVLRLGDDELADVGNQMSVLRLGDDDVVE